MLLTKNDHNMADVVFCLKNTVCSAVTSRAEVRRQFALSQRSSGSAFPGRSSNGSFMFEYC